MNKGWLKRLMAFLLLLGTGWICQADGWIIFQNNIGGAITPILIDGTKAGPPYVAQLFLQNADWMPVSPPVKIGTNGRFAGGVMIIPGDYGGKTVSLLVRIWDGSLFSTYAEAKQAGYTAESQPFRETLATPPNEPAQAMPHFASFFSCNQYRRASIVLQFTTEEGQSVGVYLPFSSRTREICPDTIDASYINETSNREGQTPGNLAGLTLGKVSGVFGPDHRLEGEPFTYIPKPNVYGTDLIYFQVCWYCEDFNTADAVSVRIGPSAARQGPALILAEDRKPALLGLDSRHYRIDRSTDLNTWEPAGSVTGNYSTVDLSSFVTTGASAHFLRATDVTAP